jgi:hypothetical protein
MYKAIHPRQEDHIRVLQEVFQEAIDRKYRAGVAEHPGFIWNKTETDLLDEAIDENIDQFVYLLTLKQKFKERGLPGEQGLGFGLFNNR